MAKIEDNTTKINGIDDMYFLYLVMLSHTTQVIIDSMSPTLFLKSGVIIITFKNINIV